MRFPLLHGSMKTIVEYIYLGCGHAAGMLLIYTAESLQGIVEIQDRRVLKGSLARYGTDVFEPCHSREYRSAPGCQTGRSSGLYVVQFYVHSPGSSIRIGWHSSTSLGKRGPSCSPSEHCVGDGQGIGGVLQARKRLTCCEVEALQQAEKAEKSPENHEVHRGAGIWLGLPFVTPVSPVSPASVATAVVVVSTSATARSGPPATLLATLLRCDVKLENPAAPEGRARRATDLGGRRGAGAGRLANAERAPGAGDSGGDHGCCRPVGDCA